MTTIPPAHDLTGSKRKPVTADELTATILAADAAGLTAIGSANFGYRPLPEELVAVLRKKNYTVDRKRTTWWSVSWKLETK